MQPSVTTPVSAAKVPESTQDLQRFLLGLEQRRRMGADAAQRIRPLGAGRALGVQPEGRRIEEDALALDLLDYGSLRQHVLERLSAGQSPRLEVEAPQLGQRVIFVSDRGANPVLGAQVAHEAGDDQRVSFIPCHLYEASRAQPTGFCVREGAEAHPLEKTTSFLRGDERPR